MMDIAFIAPPRLTMIVSSAGSILMGLAHLVLEDERYRTSLRTLANEEAFGGPRALIVDNSLMENGASLSLEDVVRAGGMVGADEIVLPDAFQDRDATLELLERNIPRVRRMREADGMSLMLVPQGRTLNEWLSCFGEIHTRYIEPELEERGGTRYSIGIPKVVSTYDCSGRGLGRRQALSRIEDAGMNSLLRFHLLGIWSDAGEVEYVAKAYPWVRSCDTSLPVYKGMGFERRPEKWERLELRDLTKTQFLNVIYECYEIRSMVVNEAGGNDANSS
jgi:hypothetical protein